MSYASFGSRLDAINAVGWPDGVACSDADTKTLKTVRTNTAHGQQLADPKMALAGLGIALRLVDAFLRPDSETSAASS